MKNYFLIFLSLFISLYNSAQELDDAINLLEIESLTKHTELVGIGESTHGTSEFSIVRLDIFKALVQKHDFNIFFLEADYSACSRVNRYILGQQDTVYKALEEIILWPWLTEEMVEIIKWCRNHNSLNDKKINFVGCDMQLINDDYLELQRLFENNQTHQLKIDSIFTKLKYTSEDSVIISHKRKWIDFKNFVSDSDSNLSRNQLRHFDMIKPNVDQWFEYKTSSGIKYNFRDSCMASNMIEYLNKNSSSKGLFFAHNAHVSNTIFSHKGMHPKKSAGAFLKDFYNDNYICIAMLSNDLHFNALSCKGGVIKMKQFHRIPKKRRDLERKLTKHNSVPFYISTENINKIDKFNITFIGAAYEEDCDGTRPIPIIRLKEGMYDGFILLGNTNPTKFIEKIKNKYDK